MNRFPFSGLIAVIAIVLSFGQNDVHAIAINWDAGAGNTDWFAASNWDPDQVPVANDDRATIANGGIATAAFPGTERIGRLILGSAGTSGELTVTAGTLDINKTSSGSGANNNIIIGNGIGGMGKLTIEQGAEVYSRGGSVIFQIGTTNGGTGDVTVAGTFAPFKRFHLNDGTLRFMSTGNTIANTGSAFNDNGTSIIRSNGTLAYEIDGTANGVLDLRTESSGGSPLRLDAGALLSVTLNGGVGQYVIGQEWTLVRWDSSLTGTFAQGTSFTNDEGFSFSVDYAGGANNNDIVLRLTAVPPVPEPATATLALVGLGGLVMRRRRTA